MSLTAAAAITAGANILGSVMGSKGSTMPQQHADAKARSFARSQYKRQIEYDREVRRNTIQDRVADARAAGIHPLYALGATSAGQGAGTVTYMGGQYPTGNGRSSALGAIAQGAADVYSAHQRGKSNKLAQAHAVTMAGLDARLREAQIGLTEAQKAESLSRAARTAQELDATPTPAQTYAYGDWGGSGAPLTPQDVSEALRERKAASMPSTARLRGPGGGTWETSPGRTPIEAVENWYGEGLVSELWSWMRGLEDAAHNAKRANRAGQADIVKKFRQLKRKYNR